MQRGVTWLLFGLVEGIPQVQQQLAVIRQCHLRGAVYEARVQLQCVQVYQHMCTRSRLCVAQHPCVAWIACVFVLPVC